MRDAPEFDRCSADLPMVSRLGVADDIGPVIADLLGPENRCVNKQRIEVLSGQDI